ncbi:hypothetical protein Ait01nite_011350 [Actinoplanes italicus]|nr:hypothetical protein Ait01nite_011350 [Actinoplanes italicus]
MAGVSAGVVTAGRVAGAVASCSGTFTLTVHPLRAMIAAITVTVGQRLGIVFPSQDLRWSASQRVDDVRQRVAQPIDDFQWTRTVDPWG